MPKLTDQFFNGLLAVYFVVFAVAVIFGWLFKNRLKTKHIAAWTALDPPGIFNNSISSSFRYLKYVLQKQYEELGDLTLNSYGRGTRIGFLAVCGLIAFVLGTMLIAQQQNVVSKQPMVVTHPLNGVGTTLLCLVVAGSGLYSLMFKHLKSQHPQAWKDLGEPALFSNNTISNNWKVATFLWSGRYKKLNDPRVNLYAVILMGLTIIVACIFILLSFGIIHT